jgi:hypothetical protein
MRLIYEKTGQDVRAGDLVTTRDGEEFRLDFYREPHKPSSTGRVYITPTAGGGQLELFPSVIGAKWIEREDQADFQLAAQD